MNRKKIFGGKDKNPEQFRCDDRLSRVIGTIQKAKGYHSRSETLRNLVKLGVSLIIEEIEEDRHARY